LKPDISIYSGTDHDDPQACLESPPPLDWRAVDLWIENKNCGDHVFRDLEQMKGVSSQLIDAYTSAIHRSQFRVFSFSVVLFGVTGRLLCWDCSGVVYTEPFNWSTEPDTVFEFLWRRAQETPVFF
jgi:hypothetical protein